MIDRAEHLLAGGNVAGRVVRVGATVRKPSTAATAAHTRGMFELLRGSARTGRQPWVRLHAEGHAAHWGPAAEYIEAHLQAWTDALMSQ